MTSRLKMAMIHLQIMPKEKELIFKEGTWHKHYKVKQMSEAYCLHVGKNKTKKPPTPIRPPPPPKKPQENLLFNILIALTFKTF